MNGNTTSADISNLLQAASRPKGKLISVVLPVYNEQEALPIVLKELFDYLATSLASYQFEITFIDDRSKDHSFEVIREWSKKSPDNVRVTVCRLARNSGSHVAIQAGINISRGDFTIVMASDGQDPASIIGELIGHWENGEDLVLAARQVNLDKGVVQRAFSRMAWKIMSWTTLIPIPKNGCDLLGMDRRVRDAFNRMDERNTTFIFRLFSLGFRQKEIEYVKRERAGGRTSWNFWKKIAIMMDAITGYSSRPLKLITNFGLFIFVLLVLRWIYVVVDIYILGNEADDLTIILNTIFTSLSVVILILGMIGDYIWRILDETRKRPVYEISDVEGAVFNPHELKQS